MQRTTVVPMLAVALASMPAFAFDPATDHTCVYNCGGDSGGGSGGGGGFFAPSGPSPAELAAQRQRRAALAANDSGIEAQNKGDLAAAVRYFEEAARLAPGDTNIQGNYWNAKGMVEMRQGNYELAVGYFEATLRYYPEEDAVRKRLNSARMLAASAKRDDAVNKGNWDEARAYDEEADRLCPLGEDTWFCSTIAVTGKYTVVGQALAHHQWASAADGLRDYIRAKIPDPSKLNDEEKAFIGFESAAADAIGRGDVFSALKDYEEMAKLNSKWAAARGDPAPKDDVMLLELRRQALLQRPIYRDASTPRSYPELSTYTAAQRSAHADNETGNLFAEKGDWAQALLSYQQALTRDPDGPFASVLKANIAIAMKRLEGERAKVGAPSGPAVHAAPERVTHDQPEEITASNCTGWMKQADGSSFRLCTDGRAQRYCEQFSGKGVSRVSCQ